MAKFLIAVALLALVSCAVALNADDARELGVPGNSYCTPLCEEAVKRNPTLKPAMDFCKKECNSCVSDVQKTPQGKGADLPAPCKTAFKFKEIPAIIADFKSGKVTASKGP